MFIDTDTDTDTDTGNVTHHNTLLSQKKGFLNKIQLFYNCIFPVFWNGTGVKLTQIL